MLNDLVSFYLAVCSLSRGWTCTTSELVSVPYHSPFNSSFMMSPRPLPKHVTTVLKKRSRLPHAQRIEFKSSSATAKVNQGPVLILRPLSRSPCPGTRIYSVLIIPREPLGLHAFSDAVLYPLTPWMSPLLPHWWDSHAPSWRKAHSPSQMEPLTAHSYILT